MLKKSKILIICQENSFREIFSKRIFQSLKNLIFPRKWGKTKLINYAKKPAKLTNLNMLVMKKDVSLEIGDIFSSKYNSLDF